MASSSGWALGAGSSMLSDAKVRTISSIINICERTTINMEREGIANAVRAIVIISMKFVNKVRTAPALLVGRKLTHEAWSRRPCSARSCRTCTSTGTTSRTSP